MSESKMKTRRDVFRMVGGLGAMAVLANCGDDSTATSGTTSTSTSSGTGGGGGSSSTSTTSTTSTSTGASGAWATEGTSVLTGKDYGNPFESGVGPT
jgi:hypothetical protein